MKELLERWAVAEPGRVIKNTASTAHHYGCTGPYMVYIDDKFHDLEYGLDTRWMQSIVQGAVQQVIEARGWQFDMDNHGNPDDPTDTTKYSVLISTDIMQLGAGYSDDSPVEALLSAYLAALETLKEEV